MELISKKKLLETIEPMVGKFDDDGEFWWSRESILRAINNAPTVEERKEGEWIRTGRTNVYGGEELMCPFCGDRVMVQNIEYELYCRQCGALLGDRVKGE